MTTRADADKLWSAVADPSRRRLLDLLVAHGKATATELAGQVPFSRQAVAKHLAVLERAGLVEPHKQGREVLYVVRTQRLQEATDAVARVAAVWDERLQSIKARAEAEHRAGTKAPEPTGR